jgi:hypothetical protein
MCQCLKKWMTQLCASLTLNSHIMELVGVLVSLKMLMIFIWGLQIEH